MLILLSLRRSPDVMGTWNAKSWRHASLPAIEVAIEKGIKSPQNSIAIAAKLGSQQTGSHQRVDFCFAQLDRQAAQALLPARTVETHASRGWRA